MTKDTLSKQAVNGLKKLALGKNNDAFKILINDDDINMDKLDLFSVSEVKSGNITLKFFDRIEAVKLLYDIARETEENSASEDFLKNLVSEKEVIKKDE